MLSFSLRMSDFSPSNLARSSWWPLSSTLMASIRGATSGCSPTVASSFCRSSMMVLVLAMRFSSSTFSVCFRFRACLMSSIWSGRTAAEGLRDRRPMAFVYLNWVHWTVKQGLTSFCFLSNWSRLALHFRAASLMSMVWWNKQQHLFTFC